MRFSIITLGLASGASAHTLFTTLFINGKNQGDGTCVRMPDDGETATGPIYPVTGSAMACGRNGGEAVAYACPAPSGSTLTFEFRQWPDAQQSGVVDSGHLGPCAVYVKKVNDMASDSAEGAGWFKIWEDGYDADSGKWCVDTLIANGGLMSVDLPAGLPSGYYLVRPEILALHQAYRGDPQFYLGCAQIFVPDGGDGSLDIPEEYQVSIPGYVDDDTPGLTFDIYQDPMPEYPMPGPEVYIPSGGGGSSAKSSSTSATQKFGAIPDNCILKNANWCAKPIESYSGENPCWAGVNECYAQSKKCWSSAPPSGSANCYTWSDYCKQMDETCAEGEFDGPPEFEGEEKYADVPGEIPEPWNNLFEGQGSAGDSKKEVGGGEGGDEDENGDGGGDDGGDGNENSDKDSDKDLEVSKDGNCGGSTGQTCMGSSFGDCCSKKGRCGRKTRHCTCKCQSKFGDCWE